MKVKINLVLLIFFSHYVFAQQEKPKANGNVFGEVFGDYYYKFLGDTLDFGPGEYQDVDEGYNAFAIRRFNLGYEHRFNEKFSARLLVEGNDEVLNLNNSRSIYIKIAQLTWDNIYPGAKIIIGAQSSFAWSRVSEKVWGLRKVEKTILDFRGIRSSTDLGIALEGELGQQSNFGYGIMVSNGNSTRPEKDKYKKISVNLNGRLFNKKFLTEIYVDYEPTAPHAYMSIIKAFVGYQSESFTLGIEPFRQVIKHPENGDIIRTGSSFFTKIPLADDMVFFARTDLYNPNAGSDFYKETFFLSGIDFELDNNISLVPNVWINTYTNETPEIISRKSDVVGRITFSYKF